MTGLFRLCLTIILAVLIGGVSASAQTKVALPAPASLTADRITYTSGYQVLQAVGNVEISYNGLILQADSLTYEGQNNRIIAQGPLRLSNGDTMTVIADFAELSADFRDGVLRSARMVLNQQFQMSAVEVNRAEGRYNQLVQAAASTCTVTLARPTPLWQFRARRIIHDEEKHMLFFENAQLRIGKVPVAYIPRLKVPDPTIKRASGFLVPGIGSSTNYGTAINAPYFLTLGDYSDVKLTPYLYSSGTTTLKFDYRRRFHNGGLEIIGAATNDTVAAYKRRGYVFASGNLAFANGFQGAMDLQFISDNTYFLDHGISESERLESFLRLDKTTRHSYFGAEIRGFRSLRPTITSDKIPYMLSNVQYTHRVQSDVLGGQLTWGLDTGTLTRKSTIDHDGRDVFRMSAQADWRRDWIAQNGLVFSTIAELHGDRYQILQDSTYPAPIYRLTPITAVELRWPLAKTNADVTQVIEPMMQLVWSPTNSPALPNDDSILVNYDATNLFSLNRFAGMDRYEAGQRANIGLRYARVSAKGISINATFGRIIRPSDLGQFTIPSGLSGAASSYVGAIEFSLPSRLRLIERTVFDNAFKISKNETTLAYQTDRFEVATSYLWLTAGAAANLVERSEWSLQTGLNLGNNWRTETLWRYDLLTSATSDATLALTYRNECIKVDLSLSRSFVSSSNISASTNVGLQVTLEGFGSRTASSTNNRICGDL